MLSRERLSIAVQDPSPYRPEDAEEMIDAFAHELAEKIREYVIHGPDFPCDHCRYYRDAADLIDSEVKS